MRRSISRRPGPLRRLIMLLRGVPVEAVPVAAEGVLQDVAYGSDSAQCMDVYGAGGRLRRPLLLIVHGGAWSIGDKARSAVIDEKVAHWVPLGWIVVSVNYRLLPEAPPLQQADDVALALATAQRLAPGWGGDPARCVLMGHSSGAHISALVAVDARMRERHGAAPPVAIILLDSAALDVVEVMQGDPKRFHRRAFGDDPAGWQESSPRHRMLAAPAPTLLLCSNQRDGSCRQAEGYAERARSLGGHAEVLALPLGHAELNRNIGQPGEATETIDAFLASLGLP